VSPERLAALRLAARLGYACVDQMLHELTPRQWSEWLAFMVLESQESRI
jgi:hypothetical protein